MRAHARVVLGAVLGALVKGGELGVLVWRERGLQLLQLRFLGELVVLLRGVKVQGLFWAV